MAAPADTLTPLSASTTNWAPTAKVSAGILAASATTLLLPFLKTHINFQPEQVVALTTLITFVIQYMVPERK
jgi:hypothetical protein